MDLWDGKILALQLMKQHGLVEKGWGFRTSTRMKLGLGKCSYRTKLITLGTVHIELNDEDEVKDTILHEIAHALVGSGHGHNRTWKLKAIEIGATSSRCSHVAIMPQRTRRYNWFPDPCSCGTKHLPFQRRPRRRRICRRCRDSLNYRRRSPQIA